MIKRSRNPIRRALRDDSYLQTEVKDGFAAVKASHRDHFEESVRSTFVDSLDADEALREGHEQENRWDYLLGHQASQQLIAVEPHSAKQDEVSTIIRKRTAALEQLKAHLRDDAKVAKWLWVASGKVHFAETEKVKVRLDQNGIEFVGTKVLAKHLPSPTRKIETRRKSKK